MSFTLDRRDANTAAPSSITQAIQTRLPSSTSPVIIPTSSTSNSNSSNDPYDYNSSAFTTSWITYLAIIVVAGVLVALISSRYFYIRRYYPHPSLRAYFLPQNGIHFDKIGLHIKGAPDRIRQPVMTTLQQVYGASPNQRVEERRERRRRRRNRQTVGETLGPGGTRIGDRDSDDGWDYEDDIDLVEQGRGGGRGGGELPQYQADSGLPAYVAPPPILTLNTSTPTPRGGDDEVDSYLPSAAEYEALSRGNRDGTITYPPPVHVHGAVTSPSSLYPSEPPPSFSRANSGISTRSRRSQRRPTTTTTTTTNVVNTENENDSTSTFETQPEDEGNEEGGRRRQSTVTASSSASKLNDDEEDSIKVATGGSSKVTLGSSSSTSNHSTNNETKEEEDTQNHKEQ